MSSDVLRIAYDAAPYDSKPIATSHIDNLATIARLHGIEAASPERCRVLELGCASGGNIVPMAFHLRDSTFVGIDLSPAQIELGQATVADLGLTNISLQTGSILDIDASTGQFDYIICHGVYSWVPPKVQEGILRVCAERLAPNGVAYISYNTYPGWHVRMMVRQMVLLNDDAALPPAARAARARDYLSDIEKRIASPTSVHGMMLKQEIGIVRSQPDSQILHEQLEHFNDPVLVSEFIRRADERGLEHVADARISRSRWPDPDQKTQLSVDAIARREQDEDFISGQAFRRSILVRRGASRRTRSTADVIRDLHVVLRAAPVPASDDPDEQAPGVRVFQAPDGLRLGTSSAVLLAAFDVLGEASPGAVAFDALAESARRRVANGGGATAEIEADLADLPITMLRVARAGMVDFQSLPSAFTTAVADAPVASALARRQAEQGGFIADLRHASPLLPPLALFLLPSLDGTRNRHQLVEEIDRALNEGRLTTSTRPSVTQLSGVVDETLRFLASSALLVS